MVITELLENTDPLRLVAFTLKVNRPETVGVPLIRPLAAERVSPAGSEVPVSRE